MMREHEKMEGIYMRTKRERGKRKGDGQKENGKGQIKTRDDPGIMKPPRELAAGRFPAALEPKDGVWGRGVW